MQITSTHNIHLTTEELKEILKSHFNLDGEVAFTLVDVPTHPEHDSDWISNIGRQVRRYPGGLDPKIPIEVKYRDGSMDSGFPTDWGDCWCDDDDAIDIVAYRVLK